MHDTVIARSHLAQMLGLNKLMRPKQWIKNGFVLAPLVFSGAFLDAGSVSHALLAVLLFCVASSAAYIINDLHDIEGYRRHPKKSKTRPLAAGSVSVPAASRFSCLRMSAKLWPPLEILPPPLTPLASAQPTHASSCDGHFQKRRPSFLA